MGIPSHPSRRGAVGGGRSVRMTLPMVILSMLALCDPSTGSAGEARRLRLDYGVSVRGVPLVSAAGILELSEDRYRLEAVAGAGWPFDGVFPWRAQAAANGAVVEGRLLPEAYRVGSFWRGNERGVRLAFGAEGVVEADYVPAESADDRTLVPDPLKRDTVDPFTAVLRMMEQVRSGQPCHGVIPVFDGRRRFDLRFEPSTGPDPMPPARVAGPVTRCRLAFETLAGGRNNNERSRFWQTDGRQKDRPPLDLWLAPVDRDGDILPVQMMTESVLGSVVLWLRAVTREVPTVQQAAAGH